MGHSFDGSRRRYCCDAIMASLEFTVLTKTKDVAIDRHAYTIDPRRVERTRRVSPCQEWNG